MSSYSTSTKSHKFNVEQTDVTVDAQKNILNRFNKPLKRVVVKIGSSLLTNNGRGLDRTAIYEWAKQIASMQNQGIEVILVSSGAIAEGVVRMNLEQRPKKLPALQACAAIGQMGLIETWWSALIQYGVQSSQLLLTHGDLANRKRYLNTVNTLKQLVDWRVIPVINENDTIAVDEIKFGDNDTLGAMAAAMANADLYIILTDQQGVYTDNPRVNPDAVMICQERAMADYLFDIAGDGGKLGSGGMLTKIRSGRLAAMGGCPTVIVSGNVENVIKRVVSGENLGTLLTTNDGDKIIAKKQWLAAHLQTSGSIVIDAGAASAIVDNHKSLLLVGVVETHGFFDAGDVVSVMNIHKQTIAIGQVGVSHTVIMTFIKEKEDINIKANNCNVNKHAETSDNKAKSVVIVHTDEMAIVL